MNTTTRTSSPPATDLDVKVRFLVSRLGVDEGTFRTAARIACLAFDHDDWESGADIAGHTTKLRASKASRCKGCQRLCEPQYECDECGVKVCYHCEDALNLCKCDAYSEKGKGIEESSEEVNEEDGRDGDDTGGVGQPGRKRARCK